MGISVGFKIPAPAREQAMDRYHDKDHGKFHPDPAHRPIHDTGRCKHQPTKDERQEHRWMVLIVVTLKQMGRIKFQ